MKRRRYKKHCLFSFDTALANDEQVRVDDRIQKLRDQIGPGNYLLSGWYWVNPFETIVNELIRQAKDGHDPSRYQNWIGLFLFLITNKIDEIRDAKKVRYPVGQESWIYHPVNPA